MTAKIYTKVGDKGLTKQVTGTMVPKYDMQIEVLGQVDELESWLGVTLAMLNKKTEKLAPELQQIQRKLYIFQVDLAIKRKHNITDADTEVLEERIDHLVNKLPQIKEFILPGGEKTGANLQYARTLARKAERTVVKLHQKQQAVTDEELKFINRLSDYLFILARYANYLDNYKDVQAKE